MSSTNRGGVRRKDDFYRTPNWVTDVAISRVNLSDFDLIIEPSCGSGDIIRQMIKRGAQAERVIGMEFDETRARKCALNFPETQIICTDTLKFPTLPALGPNTRSLVLTNPPFSLAQEFIEWGERVRRLSAEGSEVWLLLRLSILEAKKRAEMWTRLPADLTVLPRRPSFVVVTRDEYVCRDNSVEHKKTRVKEHSPAPFCSECGGKTVFSKKSHTSTDSAAYAWFRWRGQGSGSWEVATEVLT